jgi:hypothetical protein
MNTYLNFNKESVCVQLEKGIYIVEAIVNEDSWKQVLVGQLRRKHTF